jgi:hypothetical protein
MYIDFNTWFTFEVSKYHQKYLLEAAKNNFLNLLPPKSRDR